MRIEFGNGQMEMSRTWYMCDMDMLDIGGLVYMCSLLQARQEGSGMFWALQHVLIRKPVVILFVTSM